MLCPRCNRPVESGDLYCLNCGKQLKEDDAFIGEFEEEFTFDEEKPAKDGLVKPKEDLKTVTEAVPIDRVRNAHLIYTLLTCFILFCVCLIAFFLFIGKFPFGAAGEDGAISADASETLNYFIAQNTAISESDKEQLSTLVETVAVAANTTYDLDTILDCVAPQLQIPYLDRIRRDYQCDSIEALKARFSQLADANSYVFSSFSLNIPDEAFDSAFRDENIERLEQELAVKLSEVTMMTSVGANVIVTAPDGTVSDTYFSYLVGKIDSTWYVLE